MVFDITLLTIFALSFICNLRTLATNQRDAANGEIIHTTTKPHVYVLAVMVQVGIMFVLATRLLASTGGG